MSSDPGYFLSDPSLGCSPTRAGNRNRFFGFSHNSFGRFT
jgi:hypothetical protein